MGGTISSVTVTLKNLTHTWGNDIDVLVVGPGGQKSIGDVGCRGTGGISNATLTFSDGAAAALPQIAFIGYSGTYKPTDYAPVDDISCTGPGGTVWHSIFGLQWDECQWDVVVICVR